MVKVRLRGLNIRKSKNRWYVSIRNGASLVKGFEGTKKQLLEYLETPDFMLILALAQKKKSSFHEGSLGHLIDWYRTENDRWAKLRRSTKADYENIFAWIGDDLHYNANEISTEDIANLRNKASKMKWPRFADKMVSALSAVYSEAAEIGKVTHNPCRGVSRKHKADPDANREWKPDEVQTALSEAPRYIQLPLMIARYAGLRGVDIAPLKWRAYDKLAIEYKASKNDEFVRMPVKGVLKERLDQDNRQSIFICTNSRGQPWNNEKGMQQAVSRFIKSLERQGKIGSGLTLHGLRVSFAAEWKRKGLSDSDIAAMLGDRSEIMGKHYTRHVKRQDIIDRAFADDKVVQFK